MIGEIQTKFKKINRVWERYFWGYKFCNSKINFGDQGKVNYYSDIFNYLNDTLVFIYDVECYEDFHKSVFQATGIMQTIYAHQDLIDEVLTIFKLEKSIPADKNPNRIIRNELVGHPIRRSRIGNEFISSILLGQNFKKGIINYVLYSKENDYKPKVIMHSIDKIIERHDIFLNKYLDVIWIKIKDILNQFKTKLIEFESVLNKNISFEKIIELTEQRYEQIFKSDYIFKKEALLYYHDKENTHDRYRYSLSVFDKTLKDSLKEIVEDICQLISINEKTETNNFANIDFIPLIEIIDSNEEIIVPNEKMHFDYEFSKLHDRHPIFDIQYFKNILKEDILFEELNNMQINFNNDFEYYCSLKYLEKLLFDRGLLSYRDY